MKPVESLSAQLRAHKGLMKLRSVRLGAAAVAAVLALGIYGASGTEASEGPPAMPAIPVVTQSMTEQPVQVWSAFSGRLQAVDAAEIRPQVSGRITKVLFQDGKAVKAGETLFVIDPRPYEAAVASAEAEVASARTNAQFAALEYKRAAAMTKSKAIAQRVFDERANANRVAQASIKSAEAHLKQAKVDLDYAYVKAPISGRAGRVEVTLGNLVQAGPGAPLLTSVVANNAVYADFEVDEQTYMRSIRRDANNRADERRIQVKLALQSDGNQTYDGTIYSFDNRLNVESGTIRARARFENKDGILLPGMFVSVSLSGGGERSAVVVPSRAIGFDQNKKYVYIVNDKETVEYREVELAEHVGDGRIVTSGLNAGDRVIVDGLQHVRPGAPVAATDVSEAAKKVADNSHDKQS